MGSKLRLDLWREAGLVVLLAIAYLAAAKLGLGLARVQANASPVWPPAGIALAACLLLGYRMWPGIALGAFVANVTTAGSLATSAAIAAGNTFEGLLGAWLVRRYANGANALQRPRDLFRFVALGSGLSTLVSATVGVTSLTLGGFAQWSAYGQVWSTWWLGDAMGVLVVAPPLLLWGAGRAPVWRRFLSVEAACLGLGYVLTGILFFRGVGVPNAPIAFFWIPVLVWTTYRFGQRAAATAILGLSLITILGTLQGQGPFATVSPNVSFLLVQVFIGVISVTMLTLGAVETRRERALVVLRRQRRLLERRVRDRTAELSRALESLREEAQARIRTEEQRRLAERERAHLEQKLLEVSEAERERVGRDMHDELAQILTGVAFLASSLEGRLSGQARLEASSAAEIRSLVAEVVVRTQQLSRGLLPVAVHPEGFQAAMEELAAGVQRIFKVVCTFDPGEPVAVERSEAATHLYRIAQEAVTNAVRHGGARCVSISLTRRDDQVTLSVRDDGAGLRDGQSEGLGLGIMRRRVSLLGGILEVRPEPLGTTVSCTVPSLTLRADTQAPS